MIHLYKSIVFKSPYCWEIPLWVKLDASQYPEDKEELKTHFKTLYANIYPIFQSQVLTFFFLI